MKPKQIKQILEHIGEEAFPAGNDPWPAIRQQVEAQLPTRETAQHTQRLRLAAGVGAALVLAVLVMAFTPAGQAFAQALQGFFKIIEVEQISTYPPEAIKSSTPVPTFVAAVLGTPEPTATPEPLPTGTNDPALAPCYEDLTSSACKIAQAEKFNRVDLKQFPTDPEGLALKRIESYPGQIIMHYEQINGGLWLDLKQGVADEFPSIGGAPAHAIQDVMIGEYPGQFVIGMFAYQGSESIWIDGTRYRLRWMEGEHWFEIDVVNGFEGNYGDLETFIQLAESLVYDPEPEGLRADFLTNMEDAAQLAEFTPLEPRLLPEEIFFDHGEYDESRATLLLQYTPGEQGLSFVALYETPLDKVSLSPDLDQVNNYAGEEVEVNGYSGMYYEINQYNKIVIWHTDELRIRLQVFINDAWDSRIFTLEQILEIANSVK